MKRLTALIICICLLLSLGVIACLSTYQTLSATRSRTPHASRVIRSRSDSLLQLRGPSVPPDYSHPLTEEDRVESERALVVIAALEDLQRVQVALEAERTAISARTETVERVTRSTSSSSPPVLAPAESYSSIWACIRERESGGDYSTNTGNGYSGAYQFLPGTWNAAVTGAGYPQYANGEAWEAPPYVQDAAAQWLQIHSGWGQWSTAAGCGA